MQQPKKSAQRHARAGANIVRINAGIWRSRLLKFTDVAGLRPTPERVRQTVFNWLGQDLTGRVCLDLFAGTGAFGFEALSRHARQVVLVERATPAYHALMHNQAMLGAHAGQMVHQDAEQFLQSNQTKFDVIFCDPPFHHGWIPRLLPQLHRHLCDDGVLYAEAEYALVAPEGWQVIKHNKAGNVYYHLLKSTVRN